MKDPTIFIIVAGLGAIALIGVFARMNPGIGPQNIRIISIVLVSVFASILGLTDEKALAAAMGILGAIAGYVFGVGTTAPTGQTAAEEKHLKK